MIYRLVDIDGRVLGDFDDFDEANEIRNDRNDQLGPVTQLIYISEPDD